MTNRSEVAASSSPRERVKAAGKSVVDHDDVSEPQPWHSGVVAKWFAEFNTEGSEIAHFRTYVEAGQPALDVACGTGRLLIPYLRAGLDVDGCDASSDMVDLCRERAEREGLSPTLRVQAMHELDMPRRYRTVYVCGAFGLGGDRGDDEEALRRIYQHLEPGGTLVLDNDVPYNDERRWRYWTKEERRELPEPWPGSSGGRRTGSDGAEYELRGRIVEVDPLSQRVTLEGRGSIWRDGHLIEYDEHVSTSTLYFTYELRLMLERAGFSDIEMRGDYTDEKPSADTAVVVFTARKPQG
jgi:SAM-dependent methyltransferase